ncbi:energy transducer TonB [Deefgea tanakiae]|uniref:Energy transducer TonB n=1 Tax=Deefgea tanakiae TaxID=2865840 RepID=A0ABX8Z695_9NEIS|nr:energy transducer TonB [Deefgea tanakiae]QZA78117.1 energy transducer TonB [Deefgea tanakiae]
MLLSQMHGCVVILFSLILSVVQAGDWIQTIKAEANEVVIIERPPPAIYPRVSQIKDETGRVHVVLLVGIDGLVIKAQPISSGVPRLEKACADNVSKTVFRPLKRDGILYRFKVIISCNFVLKPDE